MNILLANPRRLTALALMSLAAVALVAAFDQPDALAQQPEPDETKIVQIPLVAGDSLQVHFTAPFNAGDLAKGHVPQAVVAENKVISGVVMVAKGAPVTLTVVEESVKDNGRAGKAGSFELVFETVEAVDGKTVALERTLAREGSGRGIILKIFTLFLIKGEDPAISADEIFWPRFAADTYIYAEQP